MTTSHSRYWHDPMFYTAMAAGPVFWLILFALENPHPDPGWALREPLRFLVPALAYPVVEELVFRGLIQDLAHNDLGTQYLSLRDKYCVLFFRPFFHARSFRRVAGVNPCGYRKQILSKTESTE